MAWHALTVQQTLTYRSCKGTWWATLGFL